VRIFILTGRTLRGRIRCSRLFQPPISTIPCKRSGPYVFNIGEWRELFREGRYNWPGCGRGDSSKDYFAGLDISMDETHVCVLDRDGVVVRESKTQSTAEDIADELAKAPTCLRIVFETGRMVPFLFHGLNQGGLRREPTGQPGADVTCDPQHCPARSPQPSSTRLSRQVRGIAGRGASRTRRMCRIADVGGTVRHLGVSRWRIHWTNVRHILNAPPEPRRTADVG
jgi:hypothetical protein